ncbi:sigma-70 family RNA polymerase sigma factor [Treponema phagedenis]|uniref:RNA polymerase sigma factor n=1 Tax=Treponema phagedenis TaxID=162 RepID=A0AAE6ISI5_TREPH|nr:RNA polymerase sigma factor RpoD/SigA [Treponema phagedenis]QEJ97552.1 sigma-70 family RNA polymerase sigma factor [Treponema phagedenis]QEK03119.1 sigma-70 family RNA polymerase sigma factor [Treponema phagedenis]QEK06754.1 sigma-70 family RNA polymerase sigma factor [Treponema phagedenis]QEK08745.1 sigma-70 family RNA polymerase sigma factor [Treponema phagedenis]QSH95910.1 RNA polymerase subunit sigma [Treponema phagedenis]
MKKKNIATDNVLAGYLRDINKIPLLTLEEEVELATRAAEGDKAAKDKLIQANLRFVVNVAKKYQNQGLPLMDLISEGNIGLMNAADRFDVTKGYKFISYAVWWIRQSILKAICEKSRMIRLPLNRVGELIQIEKTRKEIRSTASEEEELKEVADILALDHDTVKMIVNIGREPVSLDAPLFDDAANGKMGDFIEDAQYEQPEAYMLDVSLKESIDKVINTLPKREAEILRYRFGLNGYKQLSLKDVGKIFNLTKERIRQIEKKSLEQLKATSYKYKLDTYVA